MSDTEGLISEYIKVRDERSALKAKYEEDDAALKSKLDAIERQLLQICKDTNSTGLRTSVGTATRTTQTRYWASDWESMHTFIHANKALDLLERRISQSAMRSFLEVNPDLLPPGLNVDSRYTITVRRK